MEKVRLLAKQAFVGVFVRVLKRQKRAKKGLFRDF